MTFSGAGRVASCWRPRLISRIGFCLVALGAFLPLAVVADAFWSGEGQVGQAHLGLAIFLLVSSVLGAAAFLTAAIRPRICVAEDVLHIQNLVRSYDIPWARVDGAEASYYGIVVHQIEDKSLLAVAVQKSNLASWLGWSTRADFVVDQIRSASSKEANDGSESDA